MAMPEFMVLVMANETADLAPAATRKLIEDQAAYEQALRDAGAYLDGERLRPSNEAYRVSADRTVRGPFADPILTSYYLITAESRDAAVALARTCPVAPGTTLDVRSVMKGSIHPNKTSQQGHVYAFGVLGAAANEEGWIAVMDRIDASTRDAFPAERSLGGVRLHAPMFDGPYLESKEVIGGVFFLRMHAIEEAIEWARGTEFVRHGAVEIRELWRS